MNARVGNFDCNLPYGLPYGSTYREWVFEESRRR
jgi:hypothetical protein